MKKATIYTRRGDEGETSLIGGTRVAKDHPRVEAYGTIDELNAAIGLLCCCVPQEQLTLLESVENNLFTIGCSLAHNGECNTTIEDNDVEALEQAIDQMDEQLLPMDSFILPCKGEGAARANLCRTICRRAERRIVTLQRECPVAQGTLRYINRLSDYLFALQRLLGEGKEKKWEKPCK